MDQLTPEILVELRSGSAGREEKLAVCTGGVKLPPADLAEILTVLALAGAACNRTPPELQAVFAKWNKELRSISRR